VPCSLFGTVRHSFEDQSLTNVPKCAILAVHVTGLRSQNLPRDPTPR
jgi:hypothetical protein